MAAVTNPEIRRAVNTLYQLSASERIREEYAARRKAEMDWKNGIDGAYQRGIETTARNALAQDLSPELIQKITGLSLAEIRKL